MADEEERKAAKKKRSTSKGRFHRYYNNMMLEVNEGSDSEVLEQIMVDVESAYRDIEEKNTYLLDAFDHEGDGDREEMGRLEDDIDTMYKELCNARKGMIAVRKENELRKKESAEKEEQKSTVKKTSLESDVRKRMKVKPLAAPSFSGNIREYPSFKRDYEEHMVKYYGKDTFVLKSCLSGEPLKIVQAVDDDYEEMMIRLDFKYGRPEKMVDAVLNELQGIRKVEDNDNKGFIHMVDVVERCYLDLKKIKLHSEINTASMLGQFEKKLPAVRMHEWALVKQKYPPGGKQFDAFLEYLNRQRIAMEYTEEAVRQSYSKGRINMVEQNVDDRMPVDKTIQTQLDQIVKGLAHVVDVVSKSTVENKGYQRQPNSRRKCYFHGADNHETKTCIGFAALKVRDRFEMVKNNGACFSCLEIGHLSRNCTNKQECKVVDPNTRATCNRYHHPLLHVNHVEAYNNLAVNNQEKTNVLLMLGLVECRGVMLNVLYDPGATLSLISKKAARELRLQGLDISLSITKVGNTREVQRSKEYVVPLKDKDGRMLEVMFCEISEIATAAETVNPKLLKSLFPYVSEEELSRPAGQVDLLIGADCCELLPIKVDEIGQLQLMKGPFGYCVRGSHDLIKLKSKCTSEFNTATGQVFLVKDMNQQRDEWTEAMDRFFSIEGLGIQCSPKCGGCRCGKCAMGSNNYTIQEEKELKMIENGLSYSEEDHTWTATYPLNRSYSDLPNNLPSAIQRLKSLEKRLLASATTHADMYDFQILDMISRGAAVIMDSNEHLYAGAVHYLPHFEVMKESSTSTPLRIVFDASSVYMGHRLNDYWAKGPCMLNDMMTVLLKFREDHVAVVGDISKMYNSIKLSLADQHTHRFLWRNLDQNKDIEHYMLTTVTFGDGPSGAIAIVALRKTASMSEKKYPEEAKIINDNSFVDDILFCTKDRDTAILRMRNIDKVLEKGNFRIKHWIMSKMNNESTDQVEEPVISQILQVAEEKVLGMIWEPFTDEFKFKICINFGGEELLNAEALETVDPKEFTRRSILGQIAKVFDPYGFLVPLLLYAKVLMREMCTSTKEPDSNKSIKWDTPLEQDIYISWVNFFTKLFEIQSLRFARCIKPKFAFGNPTLIVFSDGSNLSYGSCAYIRWQVSEDSFISHLLVAKNRIAPKRQLTTPRLELCGAVLAVRLREKIVQGMDLSFSSVFHITDSMIVRWQIQKESHGFKSFVATRVGEVQSKSDPGEWWWVRSELNPADLTTRITLPNELGTDSVWQNGPKFLNTTIKFWPISKEPPEEHEVPDRNVVTLSADIKSYHNPLIQIDRFSSYQKLLHVTALIILIFRSKTFMGIYKDVDAEVINLAEDYWMKNVQSEFFSNWKDRYRRLGPMMNAEGLIIVGKRMSQWIKHSWNQDYFVLLPDKAEFTKLYVRKVHEEDHSRDVDVTVAKVRRRFWIPKLKNIVKAIRNSCMRCRLKDKELETQEMGDLPEDRFMPAPPFYNTVLDFFGPFWVKDTVKRRVKRKVFGVLYSSSTEHSVYLDLAEGYDTDSYLLVQRRFVSIRGYPKKMRSDLGSQLVCADKELKEILNQLDWRKIGRSGLEWGMEWEFSKSADAPWENGLSEALVKLVKKNMSLAIGNHILTFAELQTVLFEVANLLNERPIGINPTDPDEGTYLCPNDLLLGRASVRVPPGAMDISDNPKRRWLLVQQIADIFWKKWQRDYFHTLIIRQKWHITKRNVQLNDIVLIQDANTYRGNWRLGEVVEASPGKDGRIRDVVLRYKSQDQTKVYSGQPDILLKRSVHKLIVILSAEERKPIVDAANN